MTERERLLDELRPVAFATAYRMLGSAAEAEDVVQEVLLRVHRAYDAGARSRVTGGEGACGWARRQDRATRPGGDRTRWV